MLKIVAAFSIPVLALSVAACSSEAPIPEDCNRPESWVRDVQARVEKNIANPPETDFAKAFYRGELEDMDRYPECFDPEIVEDYRFLVE